MRSAFVRRLTAAAWAGVLFAAPAVPGVAAEARDTRVPAQRSLEAARKSDNEFRRPETLVHGRYHVLHVTKVRTVLPGAADGEPQQVEMLTYNGRLVGPTIRVRRGTLVRVLVKNGLPGKDANTHEGDIPHGMCTTNLHTHGLHVSPQDPADNIFLAIKPKAEHLYEYRIPHDHPAGTFWYHAHKHGSVAYQLTNGMAGALIVDGDGDDNIRDLEDVPEIAAARDRVFVFQQFQYRINPKDKVARVDARDIYGNQPAGVTLPPGCDTPDVNAPLVQPTAINGVVMPTYVIAPGEVQRWRLIHAGREDIIPLVWQDEQGKPTDALAFNEVAMDGLATGTLTPKAEIDLSPSNRSDVLIKAPPARGVYYLVSKDTPAERSLRGVPRPQRYLAKVVVRGVKRDMALPKPEQLAGCRPFAPVEDHELANPGKPRVVEFDSSDTEHTFTVNGVPFSKQAMPVRLTLNTAEEWVLKSKRNRHVFHIHVNPFEVVRVKGPAGTVARGEWRDTIEVPPGWEITIRTRFRDFAGKSVLHCHILDHEDQGMMQTVGSCRRSRPRRRRPARRG
jgi:FtsP/CotA-like multicopper oxidase with cupredoxin domain